MQELIGLVANAAGVDDDTARKSVAIILDLIKSEAPDDKVAALFEKMPGAEDLSCEASKSGGIFGALAGNTMTAFSNLTKAGLSTGQIKSAGETVFSYTKEQAGEELATEVAKSIPGLSKFV